MARTGQVIENPVSGERFTFLSTTRGTNGAALTLDVRVAPGGAKLPAHVHAQQEEWLTVKAGTLGARVGGKKQMVRPGQCVIFPAGVTHQWWNAGEDEVNFELEVMPALQFERTIEVLAGMAADGKLGKRAMPRNPFHLANIGRMSECYLPGIPIWMQKPMLAVATGVGRWFGIDPAYPEYGRCEEVALAGRRAELLAA